MKLHPFQLDDLSRAALHDGVVFSWDTGLGKTWATLLWPLLKVGHEVCHPSSGIGHQLKPAAPVLIVAPGDLHEQIMTEAREKFRIHVIRIDSKDTFHRLSPDRRTLPPAFYLTSYFELGQNNTLFPPKMAGTSDQCEVTGVQLARDYFTALGLTDHSSLTTDHLPSFLHGTTAFQPDCRDENHGIRCIVDPTLADLCANVFRCVVVDEGVRVKGDFTKIAEGVRVLDPAFRLVLTATPIKNRLPDLFWLIVWATGNRMQSHARCPYPATARARGEFSRTFLVSERNLTKEEETKRRHVKLRSEVCNVHRLWKFMGAIALRRRKQDLAVGDLDAGAFAQADGNSQSDGRGGVPARKGIVEKVRHVVRVPMGKLQAAVYEYHLKAKYKDHNNKPAPGAQLQALRVVASNPASLKLKEKEIDPAALVGQSCASAQTSRVGQASCLSPKDSRDGCPTLTHRSHLPYTPKMAAVLELIAQCLERREQVIVGCALLDPNDYLEAMLRKAGVPCLKLDGRTAPQTRGKLAMHFKTGQYRPVPGSAGDSPAPAGVPPAVSYSPVPVLLAGVECMGEGHSFHLCPNAIIPAFSWAYDKFEQFINRIHRLNSPKPVNVYSVICDGSADRKMEAGIADKGDAAALVLDGCLGEETATELNAAELLNQARLEFAAGNRQTVDEQELARGWPALRARLQKAWNLWTVGQSCVSAQISADTRVRPTASAPAESVLRPPSAAAPVHAPWRRRFLRRAA